MACLDSLEPANFQLFPTHLAAHVPHVVAPAPVAHAPEHLGAASVPHAAATHLKILVFLISISNTFFLLFVGNIMMVYYFAVFAVGNQVAVDVGAASAGHLPLALEL